MRAVLVATAAAWAVERLAVRLLLHRTARRQLAELLADLSAILSTEPSA